MSIFHSILLFLLLLIIEICYLKVAKQYNIVDKPNHRSSHNSVTIRGGGIIFPIAIFLFSLLNHFQYPFFVAGLFCISLVSFLDDLYTLSNKIRLSVHMASVGLILTELHIYGLPLFIVLAIVLFVIGTINAYNFMDGINGMTASYSFVLVASLYYINTQTAEFVEADLIIYSGISIVIFSIFNFRFKAKCFAGDVGSISIAFIILFLLLSLILETKNFAYILLLLIYGLDSVTTIAFRFIRRENIFEAHRSHFYQHLGNTYKVPHIYISLGYAMIQLLINIMLITGILEGHWQIITVVLFAGIGFIVVRFCVEGWSKLIKNEHSK